MARSGGGGSKRRPSVNISLVRASRLYRLVGLLGEQPFDRDRLLLALNVGLRTFYRELDLLKRCAIKIQRVDRCYTLKMTLSEAQGKLPFPDPQLNIAEMRELAGYDGDASRRLAALLASVVSPVVKKSKGRGKR